MKSEHTDVCVVGSGAGGAVIAHEAARRGLRTLLLERGPWIRAPQMSTSEVEMIPRLYKDGGMQLNTALNFFILQGSCVGGSTTVSNMVLIRAARSVFSRWESFGAALSADAIDASYDAIESALGAAPAAATSKSTRLFDEGARKIGLTPRRMLKALGACQACGNCNIGCTFGAKRSALTTFVPWAVEKGARVLPDTTVTKLHTRRGRIDHLDARTGPSDEALRVHARIFVVCGGAIGSSALLLASGIKSNVGTRLSFNAGAMMVADFEEPIDSFDADQMTSYVALEESLIEATHNPLMSSALTTPGWMEEHHELMRRAGHLAYAGAMAATEPTARVVMSPWFGHEETRFRATQRDMVRLRKGLSTIAEIFFSAGAKRVFLPTEKLTTLSSTADIPIIDSRIRSLRDIQAGSSHPQGGNPMSDDPGVGVVDSGFKIHGLENAFVCDGSVFPDAIGVNPMNTIMALAHHAAPKILAQA